MLYKSLSPKYSNIISDIRMDSLVPMVLTREGNKERVFDLYSRLLQDRIIVLNDAIDSHTASVVIGSLLFLEYESNTEPIKMYISSPGGGVMDGLGIYDVMQHIQAPIEVISYGLVASMATIIAASGSKGRRYALPSTRFMLHQPWVEKTMPANAEEFEIESKELSQLYNYLVEILMKHTGQSKAKIKKDIKNTFYMSAKEALKYGLIDKILEPTKKGDT